ncbi:unnamed protein product [Paramecium sonneborni]|uniref:Protein kinase domain-containing protein n=1 Tax=Paramecium sonneborni TaxID=65129 RepID=A0A8S1LIW1_9CILI|nr:unnamed protein product [Paramecium sonneborni]
MGNTMVLESEDFTQYNLSLLKDNLTYVGSKQHKYLGQIQLWKNKQDPQEWIFSKITQIDVDQNFINSQHNQRLLIKHENLLKYYGCTIKEQTFQGTIKEYRIYYEFLSTNLSRVLQDHQSNGQYIKETFIWKLINQISTVFSYLDSQNKFHSNINLDSLFFDQANNLKILYHGALPNLLSSYAQTLGSYNSNVSLSPQQMNDYQNHLAQLKINPYKQDSYQFGIVLVSLMSGKDVTKYTDFYKEVIHYKQILNILGSAIHHYSQSLVNIVINLLQYDDSLRPNISQILKGKIYKQPSFQNQPQQYNFQNLNLYRIDSKQSFSTQNDRFLYSHQYFKTVPNQQVPQIPQSTIQYSSPLKLSKRSSNECIKQLSFTDVYFTPKTKQSRSISYRYLSGRTFSKIQSPYIK